MAEHKVGIVSDTHGVLRAEVLAALSYCEYIFHAGDIGSVAVYNKLNEFGGLFAVKGNADGNLPESIPNELLVELFGFKFFMVHNKKDIPKNLKGVDIVIYGHSHKYNEEKHGNMLLLNPGGCGRKRFNLPLTMALLTIWDDKHLYKTKRIDIFCQKETKYNIPQNADKIIKIILKEVEKGKNADEIAARYKLDEKLTEQICRIYFTHNGIDAEGIINRLEIRDL